MRVLRQCATQSTSTASGQAVSTFSQLLLHTCGRKGPLGPHSSWPSQTPTHFTRQRVHDLAATKLVHLNLAAGGYSCGDTVTAPLRSLSSPGNPGSSQVPRLRRKGPGTPSIGQCHRSEAAMDCRRPLREAAQPPRSGQRASVGGAGGS
eukprot:SAG31_NODE_944_length_10844_cov_11.214053_8_plen_149_part_00